MFLVPFNKQLTDLSLTNKDVHIWYASLDVSISEFKTLSQTITKDECLRAEKFHFEKDKKRFIVGRGILRSILGSYLGIEPRHLRFCYGENGKPAISNQDFRGTIRFNLSHSNGVALFAFTLGREIGVDIEKVREIGEMEQIVERFFSVREYDRFCHLPEGKKRKLFFTYWTCKEAFIKADGGGFKIPLNSFEVSNVYGNPLKQLKIYCDRKKAAQWFLQTFIPFSGYIGAFAVQGEGALIKCIKLDKHQINMH